MFYGLNKLYFNTILIFKWIKILANFCMVSIVFDFLKEFQHLFNNINDRFGNKALIMTFGHYVIASHLLLTKGYRCEPLTELISYLMMTRLLQ